MFRLRSLALACLGLSLAVWAVVRPEQMYVEHLEFVGADRAGLAELRHLADVRNGTTIWGIDLAAVSAGVQRHPWVERVRAERRLPSTVVVRVEEYEPSALLAWDGDLYYLDGEGTPFLRARSTNLDYPILTGVSSELEAAHPDLPRWVVADALWLLQQLDERGILARGHVSEMAFSKTRGFTVHTTGGMPGRASARVLIGFGEYERQLSHLEALIEQGVELNEPLEVDVAPDTVAIVRHLDRA